MSTLPIRLTATTGARISSSRRIGSTNVGFHILGEPVDIASVPGGPSQQAVSRIGSGQFAYCNIKKIAKVSGGNRWLQMRKGGCWPGPRSDQLLNSQFPFGPLDGN